MPLRPNEPALYPKIDNYCGSPSEGTGCLPYADESPEYLRQYENVLCFIFSLRRRDDARLERARRIQLSTPRLRTAYVSR